MSYYNVIYSNDYLSHHGIRGMKWGIRRYQNEDGSLTEAGKNRYSYGNPLAKGRINLARLNAGYKTKSRLKKYDASQERYIDANLRLQKAKKDKRTARLNDDYDAYQKAKSDVLNAKSDKIKAKQDVKINYRKVNKAVKYDKGREQFSNGETIFGNKAKGWLQNKGILAATAVGSAYANSKNAKFITKSGKEITISKFINDLGTAIVLGNTIRIANKNKNLRAYYAGGSD